MDNPPPEDWGTVPIEDLMAMLQDVTWRMGESLKERAVEEGGYWRKFWSTWEQLPDDFGGGSVAAANRECERHAKEYTEEIRLLDATIEGMRAKRDALVAILAARTK